MGGISEVIPKLQMLTSYLSRSPNVTPEIWKILTLVKRTIRLDQKLYKNYTSKRYDESIYKENTDQQFTDLVKN